MGQNYENRKWFFNYGYDSDFKTSIRINSVSFLISFRGYWIGVCW